MAMSKGEGEGREQKLIRALSHPLRVRILELLSKEIASPAQMGRKLERSVQDISYHVKVLRDYGFLRLVEARPVRGAVEHFYTVVGTPALGSQSLELVPSTLRGEVAVVALNHLTSHLQTAFQNNAFAGDSEAHLLSTVVRVDERAWKEILTAVNDAKASFKSAVEGSERRLQGESGRPVVFAIGLFETSRGGGKDD